MTLGRVFYLSGSFSLCSTAAGFRLKAWFSQQLQALFCRQDHVFFVLFLPASSSSRYLDLLLLLLDSLRLAGDSLQSLG